MEHEAEPAESNTYAGQQSARDESNRVERLEDNWSKFQHKSKAPRLPVKHTIRAPESRVIS